MSASVPESEWPSAGLPGPWAGGGFDVEGHRGARGLVVENTMASFLAAFGVGVTGVELDVRLTGDGHVVVWHDPTLQADKCLATGEDLIGARVDDLTLEQLRSVDVGSLTLSDFPGQRAAPGARILTLDELLRESADVAPRVWWTIEVKVDPTDPREVATRARLVDGVLEAIERAGISARCFVHSFDWAVLDLARERAPHLLRSALAVPGHTYAADSDWLGPVRWEDHRDDLAAAAAEAGAQVLSPHHLAVTLELVARAHALGLAVLPWTVNEAADIERVLTAGVDGLVTDYPERVLLPGPATWISGRGGPPGA